MLTPKSPNPKPCVSEPPTPDVAGDVSAPPPVNEESAGNIMRSPPRDQHDEQDGYHAGAGEEPARI